MTISDINQDRLLALLQRVWTYSITTKSDYARAYADEIAQGASAGFLTTQIAPGDITKQDRPVFGRVWKVTPQGMAYLYEHADLIGQAEIDQYIEGYVEEGE